MNSYKFENIPIWKADLSNKTTQILFGNKIYTVKDLLECKIDDLRGINTLAIKEVNSYLDSLGVVAKDSRILSELPTENEVKELLMEKQVTTDYKEWDVCEFLNENQISFIDKRHKGGCLWAIGGLELGTILEECRKFGVSFQYKPGGGKSTNGKDGWWATSIEIKPPKILSDHEKQASVVTISSEIPMPYSIAMDDTVDIQNLSHQVAPEIMTIADQQEYTTTQNQVKNLTLGEVYRISLKDREIPLKQLGLSKQAIAVLEKRNIYYVANLMSVEIGILDSFGKRTASEVKVFLENLCKEQSEIKNTGEHSLVNSFSKSETTVSEGKRETSSKDVCNDKNSNAMISFSKQYMLDPEEYQDVIITYSIFPPRITNRLRSNQINTIADLLKKTPYELLKIPGFGNGCLIQLNHLFDSIQNNEKNLRSDTTPVKEDLISKYRELIIKGDFSFIGEEILSAEDENIIRELQEAYEILGPELVNECVFNPIKVQGIIRMCRKLSVIADRASEITPIMRNIPAYRRQNLAKGYINAYTKDEEKRKLLLSQYSVEHAKLGELNSDGLIDIGVLTQVKNFLEWCAFNLSEDISTLLDAINSQERLRTIIEMRSRGCTLEECGKKIHVTRERIRQLENKVTRTFARYQGRIRLIAKISAEKNSDKIITTADVERYCEDDSVILLYLLRNYKNSVYTYDEQLDIFIVGDDSLQDRVHAFIETLPEMFSSKEISEYIEMAKEENDIPESVLKKAILDTYKLTGEVYHRSRLSMANIYTAVLKEHYPNGIKAHDEKELRDFRNLVVANYGEVNIPTNDHALASAISKICILCGRGMYKVKQNQYISQKLSKRIYSYIVNGDNSIYLMNTLFSSFEKELRAEGIDNKYYLQGILREMYSDQFFFTRDYISTNAKETSLYSSIASFIQKSSYPVSKDQIREKFPGIADSIIGLAVNNADILNYSGDYLHTSKLRLNYEEVRYLDKVVKQVCSDGVSHHVKDIYGVIHQEKPEILTRNAALYPYSAFSILEYLFRYSYQFSRPYIAMRGVDIERSPERLHDILYSMDEFSFEDLSEFSKENYFSIQSQLDYVNSCNDKFLIVNASSVKSIDSLGVSKSIANVVEMLIIEEVSETMPIRQLQCWNSFPQINEPWTEWLVYSVLNKWSVSLDVSPSSNQFRMSIPLVSPKGKMDTSGFVDAYKTYENLNNIPNSTIDNLDNLDDLLADMLSDDFLEGDLWD